MQDAPSGGSPRCDGIRGSGRPSQHTPQADAASSCGVAGGEWARLRRYVGKAGAAVANTAMPTLAPGDEGASATGNETASGPSMTRGLAASWPTWIGVLVDLSRMPLEPEDGRSRRAPRSRGSKRIHNGPAGHKRAPATRPGPYQSDTFTSRNDESNVSLSVGSTWSCPTLPVVFDVSRGPHIWLKVS